MHHNEYVHHYHGNSTLSFPEWMRHQQDHTSNTVHVFLKANLCYCILKEPGEHFGFNPCNSYIILSGGGGGGGWLDLCSALIWAYLGRCWSEYILTAHLLTSVCGSNAAPSAVMLCATYSPWLNHCGGAKLKCTSPHSLLEGNYCTLLRPLIAWLERSGVKTFTMCTC